MRPIEGKLKRQLLELATARAPEEAVGLITWGGEVIELLNISKHPQDSFEVSREQVIELLQDETDILDVTFWHSHPSGGIGPSQIDIREKTPFGYHLVVSLVDDDLVATWY